MSQSSFVYTQLQCNPDIYIYIYTYTKSLISGFVFFCLGNTGSNLEPDFSYIRVTLKIVSSIAIKHIEFYLLTVKWFQVLLRSTNDSI